MEQKRITFEEFKSLGFYISDHPLNEYKATFNDLNIIHLNHFQLIITVAQWLEL